MNKEQLDLNENALNIADKVVDKIWELLAEKKDCSFAESLEISNELLRNIILIHFCELSDLLKDTSKIKAEKMILAIEYFIDDFNKSFNVYTSNIRKLFEIK